MSGKSSTSSATNLFRAILVSALLTGCGGNSSGFPSAATPLPAGEDLPGQFEPPTGFARLNPTDTIPGNACLSPMVDPRNGTKLTMQRAANGMADYSVPDGKYGVKPNQLLRLDCNTGKPLGIVKR